MDNVKKVSRYCPTKMECTGGSLFISFSIELPMVLGPFASCFTLFSPEASPEELPY